MQPRERLPGIEKRLAATLVVLFFLPLSLHGAAPEEEATMTTVILVRHAEKEGTKDDPGLTLDGRERARALVHILGEAGLDAIYSTPFRRTTMTASPIAELLGEKVHLVEADSDFPRRMAERIREAHRGEVVLVVSHSNTTPAIIEALGAGPAPPIDDSEYDDLFVVTLAADGSAHLLNLRYGTPTP